MRCMSSPLSRWLLRCAVAVACGLMGPTVSVASDDDYLQFREGDESTMDFVVVGPDRQGKKGTLLRMVGGEVKRDGKVYWKVRSWMRDGPFRFDESKLVRKDEKGVYAIDLKSEDQREQVEIVLPLKVGREWTRTWRGVEVKERVEKLETVKIGEKRYERCYHIHTEAMDGSFWEDYWEAPRVGWVKSVSAAAGGVITVTLREFKAGQR